MNLKITLIILSHSLCLEIIHRTTNTTVRLNKRHASLNLKHDSTQLLILSLSHSFLIEMDLIRLASNMHASSTN
jgi:hypothetical protein